MLAPWYSSYSVKMKITVAHAVAGKFVEKQPTINEAL
jgi:hypothetical protein